VKSLRTTPGSFLPAAGLLGAVLALIAGILGMHIMSGTHTAHTAAALITDAGVGTVEAAAASEGDPGHAHHRSGSVEPRLTAAPGLVQGSGGVEAGSAQCSSSGSCSDQHAATTTCTPSLGTGTLSAPAPESATHLPATLQGAAGTPRVTWSYRPGCPSPGELSISRT